MTDRPNHTMLSVARSTENRMMRPAAMAPSSLQAGRCGCLMRVMTSHPMSKNSIQIERFVMPSFQNDGTLAPRVPNSNVVPKPRAAEM